MRLLFSFVGGRGHLEPLRPLISAATAAGHDVAVAVPRRRLRDVADIGVRTFALGEPSPADDAPRQRRPLLAVDLERERRDIRERFVRGAARERVPLVQAVIEEWRPHVVVCDETDFGGLLAAELVGVPYATVLVIAAGSLVTADVVAEPLDELRAEHRLPPDPELAAPSRHLVLSPFPPSLRDPRLPLPPTARSFRPGAPAAAPAGDPPWPVTRAAAPTVYFTLGTEFNVESGDLFTRVLAGLVELPVNVLVTVGHDVDPAELGPLPEHVHVSQYLAHALVLPHCDLVVSHGGSGTLVGALTHGLPQVVVPMGADQPLNAARCEELGFGRTLDPVRATPAEVRDAVGAVLADPRYRGAAARLRAEIEALPDAADAVAHVAGLAAAPGGPGARVPR